MTGAVKVTGPVIKIAPPLVVMLPPKLIPVDPVYPIAPVALAVELCITVAAFTLSDVGTTLPPTEPPRVTVPVPAFKESVCNPLIVLVLPTKEIAAPPPALVFIDTAPDKVTGPVTEIAPFPVVVILLPIEIAPALLYVTFPVEVRTVLLCVIVPVPVAVAFKEVSAVVAPTAPPKEMLPVPAFNTRD